MKAFLYARALRWFRRKPDENIITLTFPPAPSRIENGVRITHQSDTNRWCVEMRRTLAKVVPHAGYGCCDCCLLPWWLVHGHALDYAPDGRGCFPVCDMCWSQLGPDELLPYYEAHLDKYDPEHPEYKAFLRENLQREFGRIWIR